jgi:GT2 family glycosyltransferase
MPVTLDRRVPEVSVVVPTAGRPAAIVRLLEGLAAQTMAPDRFEVLVTDDGTDPPVAPALAALRLPFRLRCEWQRQRGPAAARNRALANARAPLLLILNDDAGPPRDLLERHVKAHAASPRPRAFLGGFDFAPDCLTPFAIAVTRMGVVFPFHEMKHGAPNPGNFFWTCNVSVPRASVQQAGGFDESFDRPICEDVELGHRLEKLGVPVFFLEDAACLHHHRVDVAWFVKRQIELGFGMVRLWRKHGDARLLPWIVPARGDPELLANALEAQARTFGGVFQELAKEVAAIDRATDVFEREACADAATEIEARVRRVHEDALRLGLLAALRGWSSEQAFDWLAALPPLTTLVPPTELDDRSLAKLRLLAGAPTEVQTWSGSLEAREELLAAARGRQLCFVERGFEGDADWLQRGLAGLRGGAHREPGRFRLVRREQLEPALEPAAR